MSDLMSKINDNMKDYRMYCEFWGIQYDDKNMYSGEHSLRKLEEAFLNTPEDQRNQFLKDYYAKGNR